MDGILIEINQQLCLTVTLIKNISKDINISTFFLSLALLYALFLHRWEFEKILSFFATIFLLFILFVRADFYLKMTLGTSDESALIFGLERVIFGIVAGVVFLYHAAIKS